MKKKYSLGIVPLLLLAAFCVTSCNKINPPVIVPCYGHIDSIQYIAPSGHPDYNANISDAWVYVDDNPVGAFEMPCTFPIIADNGNHKVTIFAGIKLGGASSSRTKYPLYTAWTVFTNLKQDSTIRFHPNVTDGSFLKVDWFENFESPLGFSITNGPYHSDTTMFKTTVGAYHGNSGEAILDSTSPTNYKTFYYGMSDTMTLPKDGSTPVFLEVNYNCSVLVGIGLYFPANISYSTPYIVPPIAYVYSTNGAWKKVYVSLEPSIATANQNRPCQVYFTMQRAPGATSYMMLDDIRLVQ